MWSCILCSGIPCVGIIGEYRLVVLVYFVNAVKPSYSENPLSLVILRVLLSSVSAYFPGMDEEFSIFSCSLLL